MKKHLWINMVALAIVPGACKKETTVSQISDHATARYAFLKINELWKANLKPQLTKTNQTFSNKTLTDSAGHTAIVNGDYSSDHSSSSSSSTSHASVDVFINFHQYEYAGLQLDGTLRFNDYYAYRSACSGSSCASSTHTSVAYLHDRGLTVVPPISLQFSYNGNNYKDVLLIDASQSDNAHWSVNVTNSKNQKFSFSY